MDRLLELYFEAGYSYSLILCFLGSLHGIVISLSSLKRRLRKMRLRRRGLQGDIPTVFQNIRRELSQSGSLLGYRAMHQRLHQLYRHQISREEVRIMLKCIDREGVALRKRRRLKRRAYSSKGPSYCWHIDGNDKLVPFGLAIHGCIDGYSRKMLWLEVSPTNKDSKVIAGYYLKAVEKYGCPKLVRSDRGTENAKIAFLQPFLRHQADSTSDHSSFRYGRSVSNQRIERWWGNLYQWCTGFWIDFFKMFRDEGHYDDSDFVHRDCLKFVFTALVQADLDRMVISWNTHHIRHNTGAHNGIPDELFYLPEIRGHEDYSLHCNDTDLQLCAQYASEKPPPTESHFQILAELIMEEENFGMPETPKEGLELYFDLLDNIYT